METVLLVGATGNMGVAAAKAAIRSGRNVLAIVRNANSGNKLIKHVGTSEGITVTEADVTSDTAVKAVVDKVRAGKLPAFQHVWASVGPEYTNVPLQEITTERLRKNMNSGFEANFFAYRDSIGYLLEQKNPASTWTLVTGSQGDLGLFAIPAMTQGPLFSLATAAARENERTNVRCHELYLGFRVEVDEMAAQHGVTTATEFSSVYEKMLADPQVRGARVRVESADDMKTLRYEKKF